MQQRRITYVLRNENGWRLVTDPWVVVVALPATTFRQKSNEEPRSRDAAEACAFSLCINSKVLDT